jgi:hypothetical protein
MNPLFQISKNMMRMLALFTSLFFLACSGPQTGSSAKITKKKGDNQETADGEATMLESNGSKLEIPDGGLADGTSVNLRKTAQPADFKAVEGVDSVSDPISVTAQTKDGSDIEGMDGHMTLQIPIDGAGLRLAVDADEGNVCVFFKSVAGKKFVWRRVGISINEGIALFESSKFGVYQLFYCGDGELKEFDDASKEGIAGTSSKVAFALTIGAGEFAGVEYTRYCAGIVTGVDNVGPTGSEDSAEVWGFTSAVADRTVAQDLTMFNLPGRKKSSLSDDDPLYVFLFLQKDGDKCNLEATKSVRPGGNVLLAWRSTADQFKQSAVAASVGKAGGVNGTAPLLYDTASFAIASKNLAGQNLSSPKDTDACFSAKNTTASGGGIAENIVNFADGLVNGEESAELFFIPNGSDKTNMEMYFNTKVCEDPNGLGFVQDFETDQVFRSTHRGLASGAKIEIAPIELKVLPDDPILKAITALSSYAGLCIGFYDPADAITSKGATEHYDKAAATIMAALTSDDSFQLYLPILSDQKYDIVYKFLKSGEYCKSAGSNQKKLPTTTDLTAKFQIP